MSAARLYNRDALLRLLAPYKCRMITKIEPGFELWETGWGEGFTLMPEGGGYYSSLQLPRILALIASTMPPDWNDKNGK